jgi:hypothetical protein
MAETSVIASANNLSVKYGTQVVINKSLTIGILLIALVPATLAALPPTRPAPSRACSHIY